MAIIFALVKKVQVQSILCLLTIGISFQLSAQSIEQRDNFHTKTYFLQLERARLLGFVTTALDSLNAQKIYVQRLDNKNEAAKDAGNIRDSVFNVIVERLSYYHRMVDSTINTTTIIGNKLNTYKLFKKNYKSLFKIIPQLTWIYSYEHKAAMERYKATEIQIDTSRLDGEKAAMKTVLAKAAVQLSGESKQSEGLDDVKDSKLTSGSLDAITVEKIDARLSAYKRFRDSLGLEIKRVGAQIDEPKTFTKDFMLIKANVTLIDEVVNKQAASRVYVLSMMDEGITKSTRNLFSLAAFFGPGGYEIPTSKYKIAEEYFSPIIDSLVKFSNKYPSIFRTASIVVNGYSDGSAISSSSTLHKKLIDYLGDPTADKIKVNTALSALRAEKISELLAEILKRNYPKLQSIEKIVFENIEVGLGESLPDPSISNYKENDERRRVVVIFWGVLPNQ